MRVYLHHMEAKMASNNKDHQRKSEVLEYVKGPYSRKLR